MKTPDKVFNDCNSLLHQLYKQTQNLTKLHKIVLKYLPKHILIASYRDGTLHMLTTQGALATNIRYNTQDLLAQLKGHPDFSNIQKIKISVRPDDTPASKPVNEPVPINKQSADIIVSCAQYIQDDGLKEVLINLANHHTDE